MSVQINLNYRPETYWPESLDQEQLLAKILGKRRRDIARDILAAEGFAGLAEFFAREELDDEERKNWGLIHPDCMGGEYLAALAPGELEIARISLASVTSDQISIRAAQAGNKIRYTVCDEYGTDYSQSVTESKRPLSLGELIEFIDNSKHPEEYLGGGLLVSHWEYMMEWGSDIDEALAFAWIQSAWYPQLADHYANVADNWRALKEAEIEKEEEDEEQASEPGKDTEPLIA